MTNDEWPKIDEDGGSPSSFSDVSYRLGSAFVDQGVPVFGEGDVGYVGGHWLVQPLLPGLQETVAQDGQNSQNGHRQHYRYSDGAWGRRGEETAVIPPSYSL